MQDDQRDYDESGEELEEQQLSLEEDQDENTLLKAKLARKKVEDNYQTLLNRIALLEAEEKKAQKNFEETKGKARKIMDLKIRNKQQEQEKQRQRQEAQEEVNRRNEQIRQYNEAKKDNQQLQKTMLIKNLARQVAMIKDEKAMHSKIAEQISQEERQKQASIVQSVRNTEKELQLAKKKKWEEKQLQAQIEYQQKREKEQQIKAQRLAEIAELEQKEIELIKRLQNTRNLQQQAMEEFENVCQMDLDDEMIMKHQESMSRSQHGKYSSGQKRF